MFEPGCQCKWNKYNHTQLLSRNILNSFMISECVEGRCLLRCFYHLVYIHIWFMRWLFGWPVRCRLQLSHRLLINRTVQTKHDVALYHKLWTIWQWYVSCLKYYSYRWEINNQYILNEVAIHWPSINWRERLNWPRSDRTRQIGDIPNYGQPKREVKPTSDQFN